MSQPLPFDEINFDKNVSSEDILNTPHDSDTGFFVECHLFYPVNENSKTNKILFFEKRKQMKREKAKQTSEEEKNKLEETTVVVILLQAWDDS